MDKEIGYGGVSTALLFFSELAQHYANIRILVYEAPTEKTLKEYAHYDYVSLGEDSTASRQIVTLSNDRNALLPVSGQDIFVATIWYSAYLAQRLARWQGYRYGQKVKPVVYFIQDFEPGFYALSSHYLLADSTYLYKGPMIAIYNTRLLQEYFYRQGYRFDIEYSFEPNLDEVLKQRLIHARGAKKNKQILIYGRPSKMRNAFALIVEGLRVWQKNYAGASGWTLVSAGEPHQDVVLGDGMVVKALGRLDLERYADVLRESGVGVSLMASPHPSYPPLEMAHYGVWVLTNNFSNKDLSQCHDNIISLEDVSPENIAKNLERLCQRVETDPYSGWQGDSYMPLYLTDEPLFPFVKEVFRHLSAP